MTKHRVRFATSLACFVLSTMGCKESPRTTHEGANGGSSGGESGTNGTDAGNAMPRAGMGEAGDMAHAGASGGGGVAAMSAESSAGTHALGGSGGAAGRQPVPSNGDAGTDAGTDSADAAAKQVVYVSGYGPDIHVLEQDVRTGQLTERSQVSGGTAPSYLAFSPDRRFAYAINEAEGDASKALAFNVDPQDGQLSPINSQVTGGDGAPHLAVHPSGKWLVVAHYTSGEVTVLPIRDDGSLGTASDPDRGPQGDCKNAHQAVFDSAGTHLLVPCLGSNYVLQYRFDAGALSYNEPATVTVQGGPRHLALDPAETHAYVLAEHDSTITWFDYDKASGTLGHPQSIDSYAEQAGSSAHIVVHPKGAWLYVSNRTENSLGRFAIASDGRPSPVSFETDMLATPRDFSVDPTGQWLLLANQEGPQNVFVYRIDPADGALTRVQIVPNGDQPTFTRAIVLPQ